MHTCCTDPIAQHGDRADRFAGTVNAALRVEICIDRPRRFAPRHAAIREIEGGTPQIEKAEIAIVAVRHDDDRLIATFAVEKPGIEICAAIRIRGLR